MFSFSVRWNSNIADFLNPSFYFIFSFFLLHFFSLSLADVNSYLEQVASGSTGKDKSGVKQALQHMLRKTTAMQQVAICSQLQSCLSDYCPVLVFQTIVPFLSFRLLFRSCRVRYLEVPGYS